MVESIERHVAGLAEGVSGLTRAARGDVIDGMLSYDD